jgi:hypothetical protein
MKEVPVIQLEVNNFYTNDDIATWSPQMLAEYKRSQIERHFAKKDKRRPESYYKSCVARMYEEMIVLENTRMLCLGTRNNWERDCFRRLFGTNSVYSADISPHARADYSVDFNLLSSEISEAWDIIFSNSIDHTVSASTSYMDWLSCVNVRGYLIVDFDMAPWENVTSHDCTAFSRGNVQDFLNALVNSSLIRVAFAGDNNNREDSSSDGYTAGYFRTIVQRLK